MTPTSSVKHAKSSLIKHRLNIIIDIKKIYKIYFGCHLVTKTNHKLPNQICSGCLNEICDLLSKCKVSMSFTIAVIWRDSSHHYEDWY